MVASIINPRIVYSEKPDIDPEDVGHSSDIYELDILGKTQAVVLGKPKYTYSTQNVVYLPIYVLSRNEIVAKIGLFELPTPKLIQLYNNGDVDIENLPDPLLFSKYTSDQDLTDLHSDPELYLSIASNERPNPTIAHNIEPEESDEFDDEFNIKLPASSGNVSKSTTNTGTELFVINKSIVPPDMLPEENEKIAMDIRKNEYKESSRNTWIEKRMRNLNYSIVENEGGGDCLFAVIRDAYAQIGRMTTVDKLRELLAAEIDDETFQELRKLYLEFDARIKEKTFEIDKIKKDVGKMKTRAKESRENPEELRNILTHSSKMNDTYKSLKHEREETARMQRDYTGRMGNITTLDEMREYIRTSDYWADTWAISTLERILNMKLIIFSEEAYNTDDMHGVLNCGEINRLTQERGVFSPEYYIMTSYNGSHYQLITYKQKRILRFSEIPYDVKMMVLNKCLEHNAGVFYLIQDFRNLKTRMGLNADIGRPDDYADGDGVGDLYDPSVVFYFYNRSAKYPKPGKGDGERIPTKKIVDFVSLSKIANWRRILDDMWCDGAITIDGHKWLSVEHYMQGAKYKKGFPDVYLQFSLDSNSDLSKDIKLATKSHKGLRPGLRVDTDYALGRDEDERALALKSKFMDNLDFRDVLLKTDNAMLVHKNENGKPGEPDLALMRIRKQIHMSTTK